MRDTGWSERGNLASGGGRRRRRKMLEAEVRCTVWKMEALVFKTFLCAALEAEVMSLC